ncbi:MAG: CBS domain-containing protein [bacterium]
MENVRVGDIMIPLEDYPHLQDSCSLRQAIEIIEKSQLERHGRKSLPRVLLVFNEKSELLGTVRRRDILRGLEPEFLLQEPITYRRKLFDVKIDPDLSELSFDKVISGVRERANRPVSEVMLPILATVDYQDHIIKVIYEMNMHNVSILPVLKDSRVVGIVRTVEIVHVIAGIIL